MRFALLGNHPDGIEMAAALVASGRYPFAAFTAPIPDALRKAAGHVCRQLSDLEEVLADPQIELVIVAGIEANRPAQLRRALQAERHVLAVHPPDRTPEIAYEAGMICKDTGRVLLPLLAEALHPAIGKLNGLLAADGPLGTLVLLEMTRPPPLGRSSEDPDVDRKPTFPGWDVLRALGGEIAEVSALAVLEEVVPGEAVVVSGRFERGGLFQLVLTPSGDEGMGLVAHGSRGRADLYFPQGWRGPAFLTYPDDGEASEESWQPWDPWTALVGQLDDALSAHEAAKLAKPTAPVDKRHNRLSWEDAIRCLELDEAARRSVERRRSSVLEYQEASEAVGFKGTMTLLGCGLMWALLALLLALAVAGGLPATKSVLESVLPEGFGVTPCVGVLFGVPLLLFLVLQLLRFFAHKDSRT